MVKRRRRQPRVIHALAVLLLEVGVYAGLVTAYLLVVLRALGPFLLDIAEKRHVLYAILALLLMLGQGFLLELITTLLVRFFVRAREDEGRSIPGTEM